jgi:hypothetical protein
MSLRYETGRVGYENGGAYTYGSAYTAGIAAATTVGYKGGVADTAMLAAWSGSTIQDVYIGCRNGAGTAIGFAAVDVLAIAIYNTTLTPEQVAAVSAAMAAL